MMTELEERRGVASDLLFKRAEKTPESSGNLRCESLVRTYHLRIYYLLTLRPQPICDCCRHVRDENQDSPEFLCCFVTRTLRYRRYLFVKK